MRLVRPLLDPRTRAWIPLGVFSALIFATGCRTIWTERVFREQVQRHPHDVLWVRGVEPLPAEDLAAELRLVGGVIRHWRGGSASRLQWKLREAATSLGPVEAAYRVAREVDVWIAQTTGRPDRLARMLEAGAPTIVLLARGPSWAAKPEPCLVVGFDRADGAYFCIWANGRREIMPASSWERDWAAAGYRWILVLPKEFDALVLTPDEQFERGVFYEARGQWQKALDDYRAATAGVQAATALVRQGNMLLRLNRSHEAEAAYRQAIRAAPESAQAYNNLAMLLADTEGRSEEAVKLARNALMLDPANPRVLDTLGYALYKSGALREAADVLERARGRARWLPSAVQAEIAVHLVRVHLARGDVHLAREVLRDALRLASDAVPDDLRELLK